MDHYKVIYKSFPASVKGYVFGATGYQSGRYVVLIDRDLDDVQREKALRHELSHILLGHFTDDQKSLEEIEREAEQYADAMTDEEFYMLRGYAI